MMRIGPIGRGGALTYCEHILFNLVVKSFMNSKE